MKWYGVLGMVFAAFAPFLLTFTLRGDENVEGREFITSTKDGIEWLDKGELHGTTGLALTSVVFHDRLYVFGISPDNSHGEFVTVTSDGVAWSPWKKFIDGVTTLPLAAATFKDKIYIFGASADESHFDHVASSSDGIEWNNWQPLPPDNGQTDMAMAATEFRGKLYVFGVSKDPSHHEYVKTTADGVSWSSWHRLPPDFGATDLSLAATTFNGKMYVFGVSPDASHREFVKSTEDGENWSPWRNFIDGTTMLPLAATTFKGRMYVFGVSADQSHNKFITSTADGVNWTPWKKFGRNGPTMSALTAAGFLNHLYLFEVESPGETSGPGLECVVLLPNANGVQALLAIRGAKASGLIRDRNHCLEIAGNAAELTKALSDEALAGLIAGKTAECACKQVFK